MTTAATPLRSPALESALGRVLSMFTAKWVAHRHGIVGNGADLSRNGAPSSFAGNDPLTGSRLQNNQVKVPMSQSETSAIASPILYVPKGKYRFDAGINSGFISVTADGPGITFLEPNFSQESQDVALFTFEAGMETDAVLTSFTASPRKGSPLCS